MNTTLVTINREHNISVKRCRYLSLVPKTSFELNLKDLFSKNQGLLSHTEWFAYSSHDRVFTINHEDFLVLSSLNEVQFTSVLELSKTFSLDTILSLIERKLLIKENSPEAVEEQALDSLYWDQSALINHIHSRWESTVTPNVEDIKSAMTLAPQLGCYSTPPNLLGRSEGGQNAIPLLARRATALDDILSTRKTCRDFDNTKEMDLQKFSDVSEFVWRSKSIRKLDNGLEVAVKNSPSGGSIHASEVYFLVQRVNGIAPGIYHYDSVNHLLELVKEYSKDECYKVASEIVADQGYFSQANVLAIMTCRFDRLLWKYRTHSKAYRVAALDVGHLSQNLYIAASEARLGVFISAAVNEKVIENMLNISPAKEGVIAVCGFGYSSN